MLNNSNNFEPNIGLIIAIAILAALVVACLVVLIISIIKNRKLKTNPEDRLQQTIEYYQHARNKYKNKLAEINKVDTNKQLNELKNVLNKELDDYRKDQIVKIDNQIQLHKNEILKKIILDDMQSLHLKVINDSSIYYLPIKDETKPLIIGKKGQNIKYLNEITGCNISVGRDSNYVEISCPNPIDRTLAVNTINHLIKSEAFDTIAIANVYKKEKNLLKQECINTGKEYLKKLNIEVKNNNIYEYVGRLKYRWSFSQNVLEHCYEVALICERLAKQFNLDSNIAKECGFFHDIGKSYDYEKHYDHVDTGIKLSKQLELRPEVCNVILKHHRNNCMEDYVLLVRCADAWSAARTGARHFPAVNGNEQNTIKIVEEKCKKIKGILSFKAIIENKDLKIMFIPLVNTKKEYLNIKYLITKSIKKDARLNKFKLLFVEELFR